MTDKSGEWVEETPDYDDPKSPVVEQIKFTLELRHGCSTLYTIWYFTFHFFHHFSTFFKFFQLLKFLQLFRPFSVIPMFEEDWTVEDDDYSYEVETYSDEESSNQDKLSENTTDQKTNNIEKPARIISPIKKQISINNRYVRRKSGCTGGPIGLLGSSPPKHQSAKHQPYNEQNIQTSGIHAKQKYTKPENKVQVEYAQWSGKGRDASGPRSGPGDKFEKFRFF